MDKKTFDTFKEKMAQYVEKVNSGDEIRSEDIPTFRKNILLYHTFIRCVLTNRPVGITHLMH